MTPRSTEEPCPPVEAYRWMVFAGTRWTEVVALTKDDAQTLGMVKFGADRLRQVTVRRLRPSDDERHESWKSTAEQLSLSTRKWPR